MASLLGKADPTLVKGAAIYAQANIPGDMSEVYEQREATQKEWMKLGTEVQKAWDAKFKDWDDYTARMEEKFTLVNQNINQGKTNPYKTKETRTAMDRMRNDMKDLDRRGKKGNFEWIELEEELQKLVSTTKDNDAGILELITHQDNNDLMYFGGGRELGILEGIIDDYNNGTNSMNVKYKNGDYVYTLKGEGTDKDLSMTFSELKEKLLIKDHALIGAAQEQANNYKKYLVSAIDKEGVIDPTKETDVRNGYTSMLGTVKARRNLAWARVEGLEYSFYEYVTGVTKDGVKIDNTEFQTKIFEALKALGTDIDKDGKDDTVDTYLDSKNAIALEKEIIEGRKGKVLMADFFVNQITKDVLAQHEAREVKDREDVSTTTYTPNQIMINDIVSKGTIDLADFKLLNLKGGDVEFSEDGKSFIFYDAKDKEIDRVDISNRKGIRLALYNLTSTKTEERITPDITVGLPTEEDIKKGEMIKLRQKQYEEEQNELLRTPNRENTKKKIEQIFNTSEGNEFWGFANNPGNVTKAFTNSTYADMGMKFTHIKKDSGEWTKEGELVNNESTWMKVEYNDEYYYFDTEYYDFQSDFQKWFLSVVDPKDVAKFNRLEE